MTKSEYIRSVLYSASSFIGGIALLYSADAHRIIYGEKGTNWGTIAGIGIIIGTFTVLILMTMYVMRKGFTPTR